MEVQRRRRLSPQAWGEVLKRYAGSGTTVGEFCEREGVAVSSFHRWRTRLMDEAGRDKPTAMVPLRRELAVRRAAVDRSAASFVGLGSLADNTGARMREGALDLRLDLGGGLSLHLVRR